MSSHLKPEDLRRVEHYLNTPQHRVQRQPFRPWLLMITVLATVIGLGLLSRWLATMVN